MCGITGWIDWREDLTKQADIVEKMTETMELRGPDASGTWLSRHCAFGHRRLSVIDPIGGAQPMVRPAKRAEDQDVVLVYNGELYNAAELRKELEGLGHAFRTTCDTEVLLLAYVEWGAACLDRFNGIFAFAIWETAEERLFMARDRLGVKPLFYRREEGRLLFGSEPKAILAHPDVEPEIDGEGLAELFVIGPARTPGHGVWKGMSELKPGHFLTYDRDGLRTSAYWKLESRPHEDDEKTTAETVGALLADTLERQLVSDVPVGTLLSGGLDSSALTSLAVRYYGRTGQGQVSTFSVDYVDNDKYFTAHDFQPNSDAPWIKRMQEYLDTKHHPIQFDTPELANALEAAVLAKDSPGMADIDASLYLFCREIKKNVTVAISGEAADEIFGGYPWFHRKEALEANTFPWSLAPELRESVLSAELREKIRPRDYLADRYAQALAEVPELPGEDEAARRMRRMSYLNVTRFMPTLLDRKDRMSMAVGLEVRVPYCDHRLVQYVFNIPWELKMAGDREKGILRKSLEGVLPHDVLYRKKSPYPKTHNPGYLNAVRSRLLERLDDSSSPLLPLIDVAKIRELARSADARSHLPWFGQLMSAPQLFAYLLQFDFWLRRYKVRIV
ncbi:asparagine synthase (glutamine-hydrolyzing) [Cohnella xylanilytica]|uniref:asparagine synthase (glutamine-hydrolyzing) n=1 Tax=Cohnella xylanilytica TaxID=557555 RepID=A0A841U2W0_9BACL|nr:asparagine synthase (glutamine-hydrolyzing) [Cohnella xylanilytica]MBB6692420.1 asparagine synthase (glutamine-hydrolyzing) [Cohnella xylanilytica]